MVNESPFFLTRVECPICRTINEFETVRVGAYLEKGRDTDFCPIDIEWRNPKYQAYNPLTFFAATCTHCLYSREFSRGFREWKKDSNFKLYRLKHIKDRHLEQLATADSVIKDLGEQIDISAHPTESAVIKLHLAIFDELLADHPSMLDLGRFYLRIGWLFRDLEKGEDPSLGVVRGMLGEIESRYLAVRTALADTREESGVLRRHLQAHFESPDLPAPLRNLADGTLDRFLGTIDDFEASIAGAAKYAQQFAQIYSEYQELATGDTSTAANGIGFAGHTSFVDYLSHLHSRWDGVVTSEDQALRKAVRHYIEAFSEGKDIAPGYQQIQASYMIAELSRRVGDYDTARSYFNSTIKYGQEFIYQNRNDRSRTALARKILELAMEQGRVNMAALKKG